jgi:hypothetical protein
MTQSHFKRFKHSLNKKHKIDFNDVQILDTADTDQKLLMKEMLRKEKQKPDLNKQVKPFSFSILIGN